MSDFDPAATLRESAQSLLLPILEGSKSILKSKTFWLNVITFLSAYGSPAVKAFIASNPVDALALISAVNILMRFATSGKVHLISSKDDDGSANSADGLTDSLGRENGGREWTPLLVTMAGLAVIGGTALPGLMG